MRAVRMARGARGGLSVAAARRAPPFGSEFGRQWCLCTKLRVRGAFQRAKFCSGLQMVQVHCGASGSVTGCNCDAARHGFYLREMSEVSHNNSSVNFPWPSKLSVRPLTAFRRRLAMPPVVSCNWAILQPQVGPSPTKNDPEPSEQRLCNYKGALSV